MQRIDSLDADILRINDLVEELVSSGLLKEDFFEAKNDVEISAEVSLNITGDSAAPLRCTISQASVTKKGVCGNRDHRLVVRQSNDEDDFSVAVHDGVLEVILPAKGKIVV